MDRQQMKDIKTVGDLSKIDQRLQLTRLLVAPRNAINTRELATATTGARHQFLHPSRESGA